MADPWLDDGDVRLYHGDAVMVLRSLPAGCVQTCVTSPPYWGLRDYGTSQWEGGDPNHEHDTVPHRNGRGGSGAPGKQTAGAFPSATPAPVCSCGARRVDDQIGLEPTPGEYVERLVSVFREVRRVLRDDGTVWLNLGDSYAGSGGVAATDAADGWDGHGGDVGSRAAWAKGAGKGIGEKRHHPPSGLKQKDLVGIPWRVAFALQADGWYLRSDIIWAKPNPMPESVSDRPTKAHEYVFLLSKRQRYYYDADAVREPHQPDGRRVTTRTAADGSHDNYGEFGHDEGRERWPGAGRNMRSVWTINPQPTPEAHFATYPEALVRRCILAGTSEHGECSACGAAWRRVVERGESDYARIKREHGIDWRDMRAVADEEGKGHDSNRAHIGGTRTPDGKQFKYKTGGGETTGWEPACTCDAPVRAQTILDPFVGSGTTALVARKHARRSIGIDLSAEYLEIARRRTQQLSLLG